MRRQGTRPAGATLVPGSRIAIALASAVLLVVPVAAGGLQAGPDPARDAGPPAVGATAPAAPDPNVREEPDGSITILGPIHDEPGAMTRVEVPEFREATDGELGGGVFVRAWSEDGRSLLTHGTYVEVTDKGEAADAPNATDEAVNETRQVVNVNQYAVEGTEGLRDALVDVVQRDAAPIAVNVLPYAVNYAQPSGEAMLALMSAGATIGTSVLATAMLEQGFGELAQTVGGLAFPVGASPVFGYHTGYPYHEDPVEGEVYRDFPPVYLWNVVQRAGGVAVYEGSYLTRYGDYQESTTVTDGGNTTRHEADAWKRVVTGTAARVDGETERLPGPYVRQDVHREHVEDANGNDSFEAESTVTAGVFDDEVGESPGPAVRFDESKEGEDVLFYADEQEDTMSVGVRADDDTYVPLVGTRTESRHWRYTDTTNLGTNVSAIESHRVTSYGVFAADGDEYVPVAGFDYWGERSPLDLWAYRFLARLEGLGDQVIGDWQTRVGTFNHEGEFVAVAGARYDDDFRKNLYDHRAMVSAGLFETNPFDPGPRQPGEAPDLARYHPIVGTTYDSPTPGTAWALADAANDTSGMEAWRVSAGTYVGGLDGYVPLVGAEHRPHGYHGDAAAGETYRAGVFLGDYRSFVPLAGTTYDGEQTSGSWAADLVTAHNGGPHREGDARTTQGVYGPDGGYHPLTGLDYEAREGGSNPHGHGVTAGVYEPDAGGTAGLDESYHPVASAHVDFADPLLGDPVLSDPTSASVGTCEARAGAAVVPLDQEAEAGSPICFGT